MELLEIARAEVNARESRQDQEMKEKEKARKVKEKEKKEMELEKKPKVTVAKAAVMAIKVISSDTSDSRVIRGRHAR